METEEEEGEGSGQGNEGADECGLCQSWLGLGKEVEALHVEWDILIRVRVSDRHKL